jgi:HSP20 family protein
MAFARWDPLHDLLAIQQRLDRLAPGGQAGWAPPVDLHETDDCYVLTAEVPGLARDDLQIHVHDGRLTLSGTRHEREVPCEQYHRVERGYGTFTRTFQLPMPIAVERIAADLQNGVLTVTVPKSPDAAPRRIRVS